MNKQIFEVVSLVLVLFLYSCGSDTKVSQVQEGNLTIDLSLPFVQTSRKNTDTGSELLNENVLDKIDLFLYDGEALIWYAPTNALKFQTSAESKKRMLFINVPADVVTVMENTNLQLIVVGNGPERSFLESKTLTQLSTLIFESSSFNNNEAQASFLMEGSKAISKISFTNSAPHNLGVLALSRVAAKIRVNINELNIEKYTATNPQVKIIDYLDKTYLLDRGESFGSDLKGDYKSSMSYELQTMDRLGKKVYSTELPFYTYENNWMVDKNRETYLLISIDLTHENQLTQTHYYKVLINDDLALKMNLLKRNHYYEIDASITTTGSLLEEFPLTVSSHITVAPWKNSENSMVEMSKKDYLFVKEKTLTMLNIRERRIEYISNSTVCVKGVVNAYFTGYNKDETSFVGNPAQLPKISIVSHNNKKYIEVTNPIPTNYLPLHIEFSVENQHNRSENIKIIQYPPKYVTVEKSVEKWNKDNCYQGYGIQPPKSHAVKNMFRITTLVPDENDLIGSPVDDKGLTKTSEEANKLISPEFVLASNLITTYITFLDKTYDHIESATDRCSKYYEKDYGPGRKLGGQWRLPTEAEINFMSILHEYAKNQWGAPHRFIWSARPYYAYKLASKLWNTGNHNFFPAHVRCVYDVYKYEKL